MISVVVLKSLKMRMFDKRVIKKGVYNNMDNKDKRRVQYDDYMDNYSWCNRSHSIVREHKRNINILEGVLLIIDIKNIKHHMIKLNKYHKHISYGMFTHLSIIRCYKLNNIQLRVLYNSLLFNSHIK